MDTDRDGYVSEAEFITNELKKLPESATPEEMAQARDLAKLAFSKINMNGSTTGIDWKEMAANFATYDGGGTSTGKLDGKISAQEFVDANESLIKEDNKYSEALYHNYRGLFGKGDE